VTSGLSSNREMGTVQLRGSWACILRLRPAFERRLDELAYSGFISANFDRQKLECLGLFAADGLPLR